MPCRRNTWAGLTTTSRTSATTPESGDRRHAPEDPRDKLADVINRTVKRGGVVLIPSFAVGRAQTLLYYIERLKAKGRIPAELPVFLNSPMAVDATRLYHEHRAEHRLSPEQCEAVCHTAKLVNSVEDSKRLNARPGPMIIIAASGMATGGRVLHHMAAALPDPRNTVLFVGFQAPKAFLVGYGLDHAEDFRHLPFIADLS